MENEAVSKNFIEQEIDKDLAEGVYDHVCTRFPRGELILYVYGGFYETRTVWFPPRFFLVSAGCAIGLGNVWKFPYINI